MGAISISNRSPASDEIPVGKTPLRFTTPVGSGAPQIVLVTLTIDAEETIEVVFDGANFVGKYARSSRELIASDTLYRWSLHRRHGWGEEAPVLSVKTLHQPSADYDLAFPESGGVIGVADLTGVTPQTLVLQGQNCADSVADGTKGGDVQIAVGSPKAARVGTDSPGVIKLDLGDCASGHSGQAGAIGIYANSEFVADIGIYGTGTPPEPLYLNVGMNHTGNGASANFQFRANSHGPIILSCIGAAGASYFSIEAGATPATVLTVDEAAIKPAVNIMFDKAMTTAKIGQTALTAPGTPSALTVQAQAPLAGQATNGAQLILAGGDAGDVATANNGGILLQLGRVRTGDLSGVLTLGYHNGTTTVPVETIFWSASASNVQHRCAVSTLIMSMAGTYAIGDQSGNKRIEVSTAGNIGFFGASPAAKPTVSGSKGANAALTSLLTALATLGLVTDSTS